MAFIAIDKLQPGMVLGGNVCDRSGRILLPAGAELGEKHLSILRMWGVMEAEIVCEQEEEPEDGEPLAECDPELAAAARQEVEALFVHNDHAHPAIKELMRVCIQRKTDHVA
ncbi:hypothetical protein GMSM_04870 [Geomonas sp. Red276]